MSRQLGRESQAKEDYRNWQDAIHERDFQEIQEWLSDRGSEGGERTCKHKLMRETSARGPGLGFRKEDRSSTNLRGALA